MLNCVIMLILPTSSQHMTYAAAAPVYYIFCVAAFRCLHAIVFHVRTAALVSVSPCMYVAGMFTGPTFRFWRGAGTHVPQHTVIALDIDTYCAHHCTG